MCIMNRGYVEQMAEGFEPPCAKKHKRSTAMKKVSVEEQAKQFKEDPLC